MAEAVTTMEAYAWLYGYAMASLRALTSHPDIGPEGRYAISVVVQELDDQEQRLLR